MGIGEIFDTILYGLPIVLFVGIVVVILIIVRGAKGPPDDEQRERMKRQ